MRTLTLFAAVLMSVLPAVAAASKSTSSTKKTTRARPSQGTRARSVGPARQNAPTPERYMEIQSALAEKGYYSGPIDGNWNQSCIDALKRFQTDQNLSADGKLGSLSLIALGLGPKREPLQSQVLTQPQTTPQQ